MIKYILGAIIIGVLLWIKPWQGTATSKVQATPDTTITTSTDILDSIFLLPANQVINNEDSELEITQKFDKAIQKFMKR